MAKEVIVVELTKEQLIAVEIVFRNTGPELIRYAIRNLPSEGINTAWLKAVWRQEHFSHNKIIFSLPASLIKYKSLKLPVLPMEELANLVQMELAGTNNQKNEIYKIIGRQDREHKSQVTVAVISNQELTEYINFFRQAGFEVLWSGLRTRGIQNFINFNRGFFEEPGEELSYLDFNEEKTEFGVLRDKQVIYRRVLTCTIPISGNPEDEDLAADFLEELRLSLAAYQADFKSSIPLKVGIFGMTDAAAGLSQELNEHFGLKFSILDKSKLAGVITHKQTSKLAVVIGLALDQFGIYQQGAIPIYSLEQEQVKSKRQKLLLAVGSGLAALLIISGIVLGMNARLEKENRVRQWLTAKEATLTRLHRIENETKLDLDKINLLEDWLLAQGQELDFLLILQKHLPEGTKITDLIIEDGKIKDLSGVTPSVSLLLNKIKAVPELASLKIKGTITASNEGELFQMEGLISGKETK